MRSTRVERWLRPNRGTQSAAIVPTIDAIFHSVLGRPPRPDERVSAEASSAADGSHAALVASLLATDEHRNLLHGARFVPPGHFYSPQPSDADIASMKPPTGLAGINLRADAQMQLLNRFAARYPELPFTDDASPGLRYHYVNPNYSYADAIFLASMLREVRPQRFIEVGSGDSSCALLDINDRFLGGETDITFIEPYPAYLNELLGPEEAQSIRMLSCGLQEVDLGEFERLGPNDILFIDSTHVSKAGSDVNHLFFEILPRLRSGVYVHIHDIFGALEYPEEWLRDGRAWNEQYLLRAFLQFNSAFEITLFGNWAIQQYPEWFAEHMPLCLRNPGGSIWLRRT
jgi:hypothetical protein